MLFISDTCVVEMEGVCSKMRGTAGGRKTIEHKGERMLKR